MNQELNLYNEQILRAANPVVPNSINGGTSPQKSRNQNQDLQPKLKPQIEPCNFDLFLMLSLNFLFSLNSYHSGDTYFTQSNLAIGMQSSQFLTQVSFLDAIMRTNKKPLDDQQLDDLKEQIKEYCEKFLSFRKELFGLTQKMDIFMQL